VRGGRPEDAITCMREACALDAGFEPARRALEKLEAELSRNR
jgi:hypothetical protein